MYFSFDKALLILSNSDMHTLHLKPTHKAVKTYYKELQQLSLLDAHKEGAVSPAFANLLRHCGKQFHWTLYEQYPLKHGKKNIYPDGALVDSFNLPYGYWEAKDIKDDLEQEIRKKFEKGGLSTSNECFVKVTLTGYMSPRQR